MKLNQFITVEATHRRGIAVTINSSDMNATLLMLLSTFIADRLRMLQEMEVVGRVINKTDYFMILPAADIAPQELYLEIKRAFFASSEQPQV